MRRVVCLFACGFAFQSLTAIEARAQTARISSDTIPIAADVAEISHVWQAYLLSKHGKYNSAARTPTEYWLESEKAKWPVYDLAGFYLDDDSRFEVKDIARVPRQNTLGTADEYRITTIFRSGDPNATTLTPRTSITVTVYAVRTSNGWKLSNALPRTTATWRRDTVRNVTYVFAPDYPYSRARALRAVAFTDSLADALRLPRLEPIRYFLLPNVNEVYRIIGLEPDVKYSGAGGLAQPINHQMFSGTPSEGEEYRHELAHLILMPLVNERTLYFVSEGVPTWLGGTSGMDFKAATKSLSAYLAKNPKVTLDTFLSGCCPRPEFYSAGAVLTALAFERGGNEALKQLFNAGIGADFQNAIAKMLGTPWTTIASDWRRKVDSIAAR